MSCESAGNVVVLQRKYRFLPLLMYTCTKNSLDFEKKKLYIMNSNWI